MSSLKDLFLWPECTPATGFKCLKLVNIYARLYDAPVPEEIVSALVKRSHATQRKKFSRLAMGFLEYLSPSYGENTPLHQNIMGAIQRYKSALPSSSGDQQNPQETQKS
jgi:hypothetical protein